MHHFIQLIVAPLFFDLVLSYEGPCVGYHAHHCRKLAIEVFDFITDIFDVVEHFEFVF